MIAPAVAVPALNVTVPDVTPVRPAGVKVRVKAPAVPVIVNPLNVATPATAVAVALVRDPVPVAIVAVTTPTKLVTVLPPESTARITGCVPICEPLVAVVDGCTVIAPAVAVPTVSVKLFDTAAVSEVGVKVRV